MKFAECCTIEAGRAAVWEFFLDPRSVARCVDGVQAFDPIDDDHFQGILRVKLGPVAVSFEGALVVESRDHATQRLVLAADARDRKRGGRLRARLNVELLEQSAALTELRIELDAQLHGKMGEFGQPVIRKKTQGMLRDFADRVGAELSYVEQLAQEP